MLLTASHNVLDNVTGDIAEGETKRPFTIALGVDRDDIGFDHYRLPEGWKRPESIRVIKYDRCKGWAI